MCVRKLKLMLVICLQLLMTDPKPIKVNAGTRACHGRRRYTLPRGRRPSSFNHRGSSICLWECTAVASVSSSVTCKRQIFPEIISGSHYFQSALVRQGNNPHCLPSHFTSFNPNCWPLEVSGIKEKKTPQPAFNLFKFTTLFRHHHSQYHSLFSSNTKTKKKKKISTRFHKTKDLSSCQSSRRIIHSNLLHLEVVLLYHSENMKSITILVAILAAGVAAIEIVGPKIINKRTTVTVRCDSISK